MNDYFSGISDWKDEDERWEPQTYNLFDGEIQLGDQLFPYNCTERDMNMLEWTPKQNKAYGHIFAIMLDPPTLPTNHGSNFIMITHGKSLKEALDNMRKIYRRYIQVQT